MVGAKAPLLPHVGAKVSLGPMRIHIICLIEIQFFVNY